MNRKFALAGGGALAVLLLAGTDQASSLPGASSGAGSSTPNPFGWVPTGNDGEVGVAANGVIYDDPEQGASNDEPGDDTNTTFETVNSNQSRVDDTDPTSYKPDTERDGEAPSTGRIADPGTSQTYGRAPEQQNDDLSERAANSNLQDKAMWDRLANRDDWEGPDD